MKRLEATVSGRVQGVGYRNFAWDAATSLGLTGYVENLPEGGVKVVAEGSGDVLEKLVQLLEKGPMLARVDRVSAQLTAATAEFTEFDVRY